MAIVKDSNIYQRIIFSSEVPYHKLIANGKATEGDIILDKAEGSGGGILHTHDTDFYFSDPHEIQNYIDTLSQTFIPYDPELLKDGVKSIYLDTLRCNEFGIPNIQGTGIDKILSFEFINNTEKFLARFWDDVTVKAEQIIIEPKDPSKPAIDVYEAIHNIKGEIEVNVSDKFEKADEEIKQLIMRLHSNIQAAISVNNNERNVAKTATLVTSAKFDDDNLEFISKVKTPWGVEISEQTSSKQNNHTINFEISADNAVTNTFTVTIDINNTDPKFAMSIEKQLTINCFWPVYYGRMNIDTITGTDIEKLSTKVVTNTAAITDLVLPSEETDYLWICVPTETANLTINTVLSNGFAVPMNEPIIVPANKKCDYRCYRSAEQLNPGVLKITVS